MALKNFRPLTPTQRFKQTPGFDEITKDKPEKSLLEPVGNEPADATILGA